MNDTKIEEGGCGGPAFMCQLQPGNQDLRVTPRPNTISVTDSTPRLPTRQNN